MIVIAQIVLVLGLVIVIMIKIAQLLYTEKAPIGSYCSFNHNDKIVYGYIVSYNADKTVTMRVENLGSNKWLFSCYATAYHNCDLLVERYHKLKVIDTTSKKPKANYYYGSD